MRLSTALIAGSLVVLAAGARAACPAANQFSYSFANTPAATLSYTGSYTYTATNGVGQSVTFTVAFVANGLSSSVVAGTQMPAINNLINDGAPATANNLMIGGVFSGRTTSITSGVRTITTNLTFAAPVRDLEVQVNDVDYAVNQYRDWFWAGGTNGGNAYVPATVTPFGSNNGTGARTATGSTLTLGAATVPFALTASEAVGTATNANTQNGGTVTASWLQPVTTAALIYGNYPLQTGETVTGQQGIGIETIRFCPMPAVTVSKTSTPWSDPISGTNNPKLVPGGDLIYTLTVVNSGGSPADLGTAVSDTLPATLTYYNGDIDDGGPLTGPIDFQPGTSGLTLPASAIIFRNGSGGTVTPAAGYDPAVRTVQFAPQGSMAANSQFSVRFRVRLN